MLLIDQLNSKGKRLNVVKISGGCWKKQNTTFHIPTPYLNHVHYEISVVELKGVGLQNTHANKKKATSKVFVEIIYRHEHVMIRPEFFY